MCHHLTSQAILRWRRAGVKVWAIAKAFGLTEHEVARVLLANGETMLNVDHPSQRRPKR